MKKLTFCLVPIAALTILSGQEPDLRGTWQGTLQVRDVALRIVIRISNVNEADLRATMYSIDRSPVANPSRSFTLQEDKVKIAFPGIPATYEARLTSGRNVLTGTWTAGEQPLPLTLTRATTETAWTIPEAPTPLKPMAAEATPEFELVTIKPSNPDDPRSPSITIQVRRLLTVNKTVMNLITWAYGVYPSQVVNGPSWLDSKYDVVAQPNGEGQPSLNQWKLMIQKLLAARFGLSVHRERRDGPIYALTVKGAPKLAPSAGDPNGLPNLALPAQGRFNARNATMADLAGELSFFIDRPVVDRTGIGGRFDFSLFWTPDEFQLRQLAGFPAPQRGAGQAPDLSTAVEEQLGVKLEPARGPVELLVIDRIERPSDN